MEATGIGDEVTVAGGVVMMLALGGGMSWLSSFWLLTGSAAT